MCVRYRDLNVPSPVEVPQCLADEVDPEEPVCWVGHCIVTGLVLFSLMIRIVCQFTRLGNRGNRAIGGDEVLRVGVVSSGAGVDQLTGQIGVSLRLQSSVMPLPEALLTTGMQQPQLTATIEWIPKSLMAR